jgi:hypothetical protein
LALYSKKFRNFAAIVFAGAKIGEPYKRVKDNSGDKAKAYQKNGGESFKVDHSLINLWI